MFWGFCAALNQWYGRVQIHLPKKVKTAHVCHFQCWCKEGATIFLMTCLNMNRGPGRALLPDKPEWYRQVPSASQTRTSLLVLNGDCRAKVVFLGIPWLIRVLETGMFWSVPLPLPCRNGGMLCFDAVRNTEWNPAVWLLEEQSTGFQLDLSSGGENCTC